MKLHSIVAALAIATAPVIASAHDHAGRTATLAKVDAVAAPTIQVNCKYPNWPTPRQVAKHSRVESSERVDELRRQILTTGRQTCDQGFTHVRIEFLPSTQEVAIGPASNSSSRDRGNR